MPRTLIAYSTVDGHTLTICRRIRDGLGRHGHDVRQFEIGTGTAPDLASFDQVVVGASIRYGRHRPAVHRFVDLHRAALERLPNAFFSVNVVARKAGKDTPAGNPYVRAFLRRTAWQPRRLAVFAGRLDYPAYGVVDRQLIRLVMWLTGGPTDPRGCFEFTDWQAVDTFALELAGAVAAAAADGAGGASAAAADIVAARSVGRPDDPPA